MLSCLMASCGSGGKTYRIAIDPSWYPLDLQGKEANVYAFSDELLRAISLEEHVFFERITMSWDNLLRGLKVGECEAILSSMTPRVSLESTYMFSEPFLHTGPVLVIPKGAKLKNMKKLAGMEIAVGSMTNETILIEKFPGVIVRYIGTIPEGLEDILTGQIDGVLLNYLQATSYIRDLYYDTLKIATPPLDNAGLRLITLHGQETELVDIFNSGLNKLCDSGALDKLLKKWELN